MLPFPTYNIPDSLINETDTGPKRLIFLTSQPPTASQSELITKISGALKIDFEKEALCHVLHSLNAVSIQGLFTSETELVISFGVKPDTVGIWIDLQGAGIRFLEQFAFILTISLADLEKNANAKKILWGDMQHFMEMKARENA